MAKTQTVQRTDAPEIASSKGEVVPFQPARLPYHSAIEERFGIDRAGWNALVGAVWPSAKTVDAIVMALSYCRARNLDPFKRPVHIVPMWSSAIGDYVETVWPGIAELRTTAFRTGNYAGCDETEFGPQLTQTFKGQVKDKGSWVQREATVTFPEWTRITVYRELNGRICKFVGPKVLWIEAYATTGRGDLPNEMWQTRPFGQPEKCAEAAALRKAFPEEIGNQLTAEEMEGRHITEAREPVIEPPAPPSHDPTALNEPTAGAPAEHTPAEAQVVWEDAGERPATAADVSAAAAGDPGPIPEFLRRQPTPAPTPPSPPAATTDAPAQKRGPGRPPKVAAPAPATPLPAPPAEPKVDAAQWLRDLEGAVGGCEDLEQLAGVQQKVQVPMRGKVPAEAWTKGKQIVLARSAVLLGNDED